MTTTQIIDMTSIFTSEQFYEEEKLRIEKLAGKAKTALETPITDKASYKINHDTQMELRDERIKWEKARKDFTASLDEKKKFAIDRERSITCHIIPVEEELKAKKEAYDQEQERIKAEEEAQKTKVFQERVNEMASYGYTTDLAALRDMSDEGFRMMADMYKKKWEEAEKVRIEQEAEKAKLEESKNKYQERANKLFSLGLYFNGEIITSREAQDINVYPNELTWMTDEEFDKTVLGITGRLESVREEARKLKEENDRKSQELADREKAIQDAENEKTRQEELKATAEKAREDERQRIENERIAKEQTDLAEKARMEKEAKYIAWLRENGYTNDTREEFKVEKVENEVILWKKVSVYKI